MECPDIKAAISKLYAEFERIGDEHEEFTDTDVREAVHIVLNHYFVWGNAQSKLPICYEMFSRDGDVAVSEAIRSFLACVTPLVKRNGLLVGQVRLDLLQDASLSTPNGLHYDDLIGHSDKPLPSEPLPEHLFEEGEYDE